MAVFVEGISVVARKATILSNMAEGEARFRQLIPDSTYCDDGKLARVGFLASTGTFVFVEELVEAGLSFMESGQCLDIAVCDLQRGPTRVR